MVVSVPLRNSSPLPRPRVCACDRVGCHWGPLRSFISYKHSVGRKEASVPICPWGLESQAEETVRPGPEAVTQGRAGWEQGCE